MHAYNGRRPAAARNLRHCTLNPRAEQQVDLFVRRAQPLLGTIVEIAVDPASAHAVNAGFDAIRHIHARMSFYETGSDLTRLRAAALGDLCEVDWHTVVVLRVAAMLHAQSGGLFDVTVGRALVRSGFLPKIGLSHLNHYRGAACDIEIVDDTHIRLAKAMLIDLGGIAKGYAVDRGVDALLKAGATRGIVNAGGDLRVFGDYAAPVEIKQPDGRLSAPLMVRECAVASSENVHRRHRRLTGFTTPHVRPNGKAMLIDQTISVVANSCVIADAMTKVAMVDADLADRLLAAHDGQVVRLQMSEAA